MSEIMKAFSSRLSRRAFLAGLGAAAALTCPSGLPAPDS